MALTQISTAGVKDDAVTAGKIPADAVGSSEIAANAVGSSELADNAVDTAAIAADAVTGAKIADDAVGAEHIEVLDAALQFGDSVKAQFGNSDDLSIYHDGSGSAILNGASSGQLTIASDNALNLCSRTNTEYFFRGYTNGSAELFYDNSKKLETTDTGVQLSHTGDCQLRLLADSDNNGSNNWPHIQFRVDNTSGQAEAQVAYRQDNAVLKVDIAGTEKVGVNANGLVFNGDTAAANALDDYEEGTWTASVYWNGGNTTGSYAHTTTVTGTYTKIGDICQFNVFLNPGNYNSGSDAVIVGVSPPFTTSTQQGVTPSFYSGQGNYGGWLGTSYDSVFARINASGNFQVSVGAQNGGSGYFGHKSGTTPASGYLTGIYKIT